MEAIYKFVENLFGQFLGEVKNIISLLIPALVFYLVLGYLWPVGGFLGIMAMPYLACLGVLYVLFYIIKPILCYKG